MLGVGGGDWTGRAGGRAEGAQAGADGKAEGFKLRAFGVSTCLPPLGEEIVFGQRPGVSFHPRSTPGGWLRGWEFLEERTLG